MAMIWHTPSCPELPPELAAIVRQELMDQAFKARECYSCLSPLRDPSSTYCSVGCRASMAAHPNSHGTVDRALVINLPSLAVFVQHPDCQRYAAHAA